MCDMNVYTFIQCMACGSKPSEQFKYFGFFPSLLALFITVCSIGVVCLSLFEACNAVFERIFFSLFKKVLLHPKVPIIIFFVAAAAAVETDINRAYKRL